MHYKGKTSLHANMTEIVVSFN